MMPSDENREKYRFEFSKKIVTFLGAGASARFGYPTTKVFLEKLSDLASDKEGELLASLRILKRTVEDVEHVVEILDLILELDSISKKGGRLEQFLQRFPLNVDFASPVTKDENPPLTGKVQWDDFVTIARKLRAYIEELVFQQYESKIDKFAEIEKEYSSYFSVLHGHTRGSENMEVFTTNYDNVIEDYSRRSETPCTLSVLNHDYEPKSKAKDYELKKRIVLTKLHGSLDWIVDKENNQIEVVPPQTLIRNNSTRWERNEFVLFGTKPKLEEDKIYKAMLDRLSEKLVEANVCIVIGFSFRDLHINKFFNDAISKNKSLKLLILSRSPKESAENLINNSKQLSKLIRVKRIVPLRCSFGTPKAIRMIEENLK